MQLSRHKAFYRPELDVVRFFAFFAVFLHHGLPASSSHSSRGAIVRALSLGLPLFFCLSAFLITKLLLLEQQQAGRIDLSKFYKRRMLRIWPLYLSILAISAAISALHHTIHITRIWYVAALFMLANTVWWIRTTVAHLWSISVEEQFYIFWPTLVRRLSRHSLSLCVFGMFVVSNTALLLFGLLRAQQGDRIWANTFVQLEFFAPGIWLALRDDGTHNCTLRTRLCTFAAALVLWFYAVRGLHAFANPGEATVGPLNLCAGYALAALGCLLIMLSIQGTKSWPGVLVYLGKISYGLYIFHGIALTAGYYFMLRFGRVTSLLTSFILNVGLAALSYHFFESHFLRLKQRYEIVRSRPIGP